MKGETMKPDCHECKYRRSIPGDRHSKCVHPDVELIKAVITIIEELLNSSGKPEEKEE
jgi:hypothetical protein